MSSEETIIEVDPIIIDPKRQRYQREQTFTSYGMHMMGKPPMAIRALCLLLIFVLTLAMAFCAVALSLFLVASLLTFFRIPKVNFWFYRLMAWTRLLCRLLLSTALAIIQPMRGVKYFFTSSIK